VSVAHCCFVLDCPEFTETGKCVCNSVNKAGQLLVDLAAATSMAIATVSLGMMGSPLLLGMSMTREADRVLLSPAVFKLVDHFEIDTRASEHAGLSTVFRVCDLMWKV